MEMPPNNSPDSKALAAALCDLTPGQIQATAWYPPGTRWHVAGEFAVIIHTGQKYTFTPAQVSTVFAQGRTAYRTERGTFTAADQQDADGAPELIAPKTKAKAKK